MTVSNESLLHHGTSSTTNNTGLQNRTVIEAVSRTGSTPATNITTTATSASAAAAAAATTTSIRVIDHTKSSSSAAACCTTTILPTSSAGTCMEAGEIWCGLGEKNTNTTTTNHNTSILDRSLTKMMMMNPTSLIQKRHNDARYNPSAIMDTKQRTSSSLKKKTNKKTSNDMRRIGSSSTEQSFRTIGSSSASSSSPTNQNIKINHEDGTIIIYSKSSNGTRMTDGNHPHPHHQPQHQQQQYSTTAQSHNNSDNTNTDFYYYTEIPFVSVHGMQTRQRHLQRRQLGGGKGMDESTQLGDDDSYHCLETCNTNSRNGGKDDAGHNNNHNNKNNKNNKHGNKSIVTRYLIIATIANAIPQFLMGYNLSVLNTPEKYIFPGHTTLAWSFTVSSLAIGAPLGAYIGGGLADIYGRKWALGVNGLGFLVAGILQTFAPTLPVLTVARFVVGLMSGIASVLVPIYLGELAPPHLRGTLGTVNQFAMVVGIFVADLLSIQFASDDGWRILLSFTSGLAIVQLLLMPWVVESPLFLLRTTTSHDNVQAREVLQQLRGYTSHEDLDAEVEMYLQYADDDGIADRDPVIIPSNNKHESDANNNNNNGTANTVLKEMMTSEYLRFLFVCCILLNLAEELCGVNAGTYTTMTPACL
jgi:hypothetical protein